MELSELKEYLRIDGDDEDGLLRRLEKAAREYIASAVGVYDETDPTAEQLLGVMVQDMYDHRQLMQSDVQEKKRMQYTYGSLLLQLQMKYEAREEAAHGAGEGA
ncbi:head-tail connector protein [Stomatobaculum longum]|jgi:DNA packaging protein, QLRG family|uniref:head-tail connector protein n=1 Tax=Stomatobaculum longum TaxID=796942 RepID=UPI00204FF722|nr:head-tail connector protein [Stomatobaculum longum]DAJ20199.1 MAG TPA: head tail connector [Siphoviridae sp. ctjRi1]